MNCTARNLPLHRAIPSPALVPGYGVPAVPRSESQPTRRTPKSPHPGTRISRRAFTAAELMIALVLSSIVAMAALGLLGTIYASDTAAQKRFDDEAQLQTLQRAVRALSRSITAKRAPDPSSGFGAEPSDAEITAAENELRATYDKAGQPYTPESIRSAAVENARKTKREANANAPDEREHIPPRFEVRFDSTGSGGAVPVLEALLSDAPVPPAWSADLDAQRWAMSANLIRGVIEGVRSDDFEKTGWTLQWRQIEPPADPVKLASGIAGWEWSVLPRKAHDKDNVGFVETAAAWYGTDYPRALRLRVATMKGAQADWLFDMPRPIPEIADADDAQQAAEEAKESGIAPILQDLPIAGQPNFVDPKQGTGVPIRNQRGTDFKSRINGSGGGGR